MASVIKEINSTFGSLSIFTAVNATTVATLLTAVRFGGGEKYLRNSVGQLVDSGSPDYAYDGTSGSDAVVVQSHVSASDTVGLREPWNALTDTSAGLTVVGEPGPNVGWDGVDDPINAAGLTPTSTGGSGDLYTGLVPPGASVGSFAVYFNYAASTEILISALTGSVAGLYCFHTSGQVRVRLEDTAGNTIADINMNTTLPLLGERCVLLVEYDDNTPGTGTGTLKTAVWSCDTPGEIDSGTITYATATADHTASLKIGENLNGTVDNGVAGLVIETIAGRVITDGSPLVIANGTDPSGGLTRVLSLQGLVTGVGTAADLVWSEGTGGEVTAQ